MDLKLTSNEVHIQSMDQNTRQMRNISRYSSKIEIQAIKHELIRELIENN